MSIFVSLIFFSSAFGAEITDSLPQENHPARESLFPEASIPLSSSHFTWGVELGSSIDLTGHDMSSMDLDVQMGYKNDYIRFIGAGVGVARSFGTGNSFIPVYLMLRSSFRKKPSLFFLSAKMGYSFNTIDNSATYGDFTSSLGLGINLTQGRKFKSHFVIACGYRHFRSRHQETLKLGTNNITLAQIAFGMNF